MGMESTWKRENPAQINEEFSSLVVAKAEEKDFRFLEKTTPIKH